MHPIYIVNMEKHETIHHIIITLIQALSLVESHDLLEDRRTNYVTIKLANSVSLFVRVIFVKF